MPTALHLAVEAGELNMVRYLVENAGANLEYMASVIWGPEEYHDEDPFDEELDGWVNLATPLHRAVSLGIGSKEMIELLLDLGANIEAKDMLFFSVLQNAVLYAKCSETVKLLLLRGAEVNVTDGVDSNATAMHWVMLEIERSWIPDERKWTEDEYKELIKIFHLLAEHGADFDAEDYRGQTPRDILEETLELPLAILEHEIFWVVKQTAVALGKY
jgi:ankyrin repeat protein